MKRGLTLVEVLVVMAILAVLVGILMPALNRAGQSARSMQCQANLRQLFAMAESYSNRNEGRYPIAVRYENYGEFTTIAWDWHQTSSGGVSLGPLWKGVINPGQVQQCPECLACGSTFGADPFTGYNYNTTYIGGEATFPQTGWAAVRPGLPRGVWRRVETTAVFGDGGWSGGANKFMRAPMNTIEHNLESVYAGGQAFRHGGRTNVCWLDGHTSASGDPRPGDLATDHLLNDIMAWPRNGFLSDDDSAYDPR